jgi:hypothetical protein
VILKVQLILDFDSVALKVLLILVAELGYYLVILKVLLILALD